MRNGKLIFSDGTECWYKDDLLHREDGPAYTTADLTKIWYFKGKRHRVDGPAYIESNGYEAWYLNGFRHREDGPAVVFLTYKRVEWWLDDISYSKEGWWEMLSNEAKLKAIFNGEGI